MIKKAYQKPPINVVKLQHKTHILVGSIAHYFTDQLAEAVESEGYTLGTILHNPIEGLIKYHSLN